MSASRVFDEHSNFNSTNGENFVGEDEESCKFLNSIKDLKSKIKLINNNFVKQYN